MAQFLANNEYNSDRVILISNSFKAHVVMDYRVVFV